MKICILGDLGNYTKYIIVEFIKNDINFDIVIEKSKIDFEPKNFVEKLIFNLYHKIKLSNNYTYKSLPKNSVFFWKKFINEFLYRKSKQYYELTKHYNDIQFSQLIENINVLHTYNINDICVFDFLQKNKYEIGILGGVGIINQQIINCFENCINAHPAPLPQCRGGGAIENTFLYNLRPATSIHKVTNKIDAGDIIEVKNIDLCQTDNYYSIETKLKIEGAKLLAKIVKKIKNNEPIKLIQNNGKLHYFKDCNLRKQKLAHKKLKTVVKSLK